MDIDGMVRVAKQNTLLATRGLDKNGLIALYIQEIPVQISRRKARRCAGFFHGAGVGDVGRIVLNLGLNATEDRFMGTLYHELAHAVTHWLHGNEADIHGPKWKAVMEQLGQKK